MFQLAVLSLLTLQVNAVERIRVSSFSTILTEIAEQVGGDRVEVTAHVKPGSDPHEFEPKPADLKTVADSQLVLLSAKHMEGYVGKLREATGGKGNFLEVGDGFASLKMKGGHDHGHGHGHDHAHAHGKDSHSDEDPHWWHSVGNVQKATKIVRDALTKISPADTAAFSANASKYLARLDALQKWTKAKLAELPRNKRKLVTSHDAFQYFAQENGFTIYAVEGVSSADQPSAKHVAELIKVIKEQRVKAVFTESFKNPKVLTEITRETGAVIGGELHADGLGAGDAGTFEGMYKHNVSMIVDALK
jgi:zinc/manganese transport system substrate-binding protein